MAPLPAFPPFPLSCFSDSSIAFYCPLFTLTDSPLSHCVFPCKLSFSLSTDLKAFRLGWVGGHWLQRQRRQARPDLGGSSCVLTFLLSPNSLVVGFESRLRLTLNQDKATFTSAAAGGGRRWSPVKSTNGHWTSCDAYHWARSGEYRGEGPRSWLWRTCSTICDLMWWSKDRLFSAKFCTIKWASQVLQWERIHCQWRRCRFDPWVWNIP